MNADKLTPAPIDNKNVLEDFADGFAYELNDSNEERQTFWRDGCLFLIDYTFGTNKGVIRCLYGTPTRKTLRDIMDGINELLSIDYVDNPIYCHLTEAEKDICFAFYWKAC